VLTKSANSALTATAQKFAQHRNGRGNQGFIISFLGRPSLTQGLRKVPMPIRRYIASHSAFEPDEIAAMSRALDETCTALHVNGHAKDRETIAARIIDLARDGLIDPVALRERVVAEAKAMSVA
jgi:hypothetical protein